jgi:hypothetical protein
VGEVTADRVKFFASEFVVLTSSLLAVLLLTLSLPTVPVLTVPVLTVLVHLHIVDGVSGVSSRAGVRSEAVTAAEGELVPCTPIPCHHLLNRLIRNNR